MVGERGRRGSTSFSQTEEEARRHHPLEIMRQPHRHHHNPPEHHDRGDEDGRPEPLEEDVGQRLEERVGDEEDGQAGVVLPACDVQRFLEAVEFGVADVGPVEKGDEVEEAEPGDQAQVEFPEELTVLDEEVSRFFVYAIWRSWR